jgi:hypothetical protein
MAISYPLVIPGVIGAAKANLKKFDAVGEVISPFGGSAQQQQFADQHWELDLEWPEMTWAQYAALDAFSGALHGKLGSFVWGPPLATGTLGLGNLGGTPTCVGTDLSGSNLLTTQGWLPNKSGLLLPGDFLMLGTPYAATSDGNPLPTFALTAAANASGGQTVYTGNFSSPSGANNALAGATFEVTGFEEVRANDGTFLCTASTASTITLNNPDGGADTEDASAQQLTAPTGFGLPRLYQYVNPLPLASGGGGNASIDIFPSIREAPPAGMAVTLVNPQGTFRLAANRRESPATKTKTFTFMMKCREAI